VKLEPVTYAPSPIPKGYREIDRYPLYEPFAYAVIAENEDTGELLYVVDELKLNEDEKEIYKKLIEVLEWELKPFEEPPKDPIDYFAKEAQKVINKYRISLGRMANISWSKIIYYIERDLLGYGPIDPLMRDPYIEDISCDGINKPVYVWHRNYESLPTTIVFTDEEELDNFVIKLAHMAGKHISSAFPILDAILPGQHRLAATFRKEVSTTGSTFTIRKFREDPITIIDLINFKTISPELGAYFWLMMEYKMSSLVIGVTGSGKTSTINALACLFRPTIKVVTIEDTAELKIPLENWVPLVSRPSYGIGPEKVGEVTLYDLVRLSLRYRPDIIIVGEVRGEEAFVLFQAIATGHGGITSIHAEDQDSAIKRLTSPPMNIPPPYIPLVNIAFIIRRVSIPDPSTGTKKTVRRIVRVYEIKDFEDYIPIVEWNPIDDVHVHDFSKSILIPRISRETGIPIDHLLNEINTRAEVLSWMAKNKIRYYRDVAKIVHLYYAKPQQVHEMVGEAIKGVT